MRRNWRRIPTSSALAISPRQVLGRIALVLMVISCAFLIALSRNHHPLTRTIHTGMADAAAPLLDLLSRPGKQVADFSAWMQSLANIYAQNQELKTANAKLMQWQQVALQLEAENAALRELMNYTSTMPFTLVTAKVVGDRSGPFARNAIINAGSKHGIVTGQALINNQGLVGRVVEPGTHSARILLLTDINSRIPVMSERSRERAIAAGSNTDSLRLLYLADNSEMAVGETIFTSGDGETVPPGLPVGKVTSVEHGVVTVEPFADWYHLDYVSALVRPQDGQ